MKRALRKGPGRHSISTLAIPHLSLLFRALMPIAFLNGAQSPLGGAKIIPP